MSHNGFDEEYNPGKQLQSDTPILLNASRAVLSNYNIHTLELGSAGAILD